MFFLVDKSLKEFDYNMTKITENTKNFGKYYGMITEYNHN